MKQEKQVALARFVRRKKENAKLVRLTPSVGGSLASMYMVGCMQGPFSNVDNPIGYLVVLRDYMLRSNSRAQKRCDTTTFVRSRSTVRRRSKLALWMLLLITLRSRALRKRRFPILFMYVQYDDMTL